MAEPTPDGNRRGSNLGECANPAFWELPWRAEILQRMHGNMMMNGQSYALTFAAVVLGGAVLAPAALARSATYDGRWSVLVITRAGTCDAAYRYGVTVENGAVRYAGESGVDVRGNVDDRGHVRVVIGRGQQSAEGTGQLTGQGGGGTWSGRSPDSRCSGVWEAERR